MDEKKGKKKPVDEAGIRLAPTPLRSSEMNVLPPVRQDFIITPHIEINEKAEQDKDSASTLDDYQPKKEEISKRWKRGQRGKNILTGSLVFIITIFAVLPYILGACGVDPELLPFRYIPVRFSSVGNIIKAFTVTASEGWAGDTVNQVWINAIPDLVIVVGIIALVINAVKSLYAMFAAVKQQKYAAWASVYLICILAVFIAALVGIPQMGIEKMDFINDFIYNCSTCELFTMVVIAFGYLVVTIVISSVGRDKQGYLA